MKVYTPPRRINAAALRNGDELAVNGNDQPVLDATIATWKRIEGVHRSDDVMYYRFEPDDPGYDWTLENVTVLIREAVEVDTSALVGPLRSLAEWLVSLDEPDSKDRRTVNLNQIIDRARKALGVEEV